MDVVTDTTAATVGDDDVVFVHDDDNDDDWDNNAVAKPRERSLVTWVMTKYVVWLVKPKMLNETCLEQSLVF